MKNTDYKSMAQALKLACLGGRDVAPNPMVGAVIVKNGKVIGKGYHKKFGGPHAEVNAIRFVRNKADLKGATMYVTLEPCRHHGKTPPCLGLIEEVGIARVVCGSADPFQQKIENRKSKIEVVFLKGLIAEECKQLNKFFYAWVTKKRPFVTVKVAMSVDGFVARPNGEPVRFTNAKQDKEVHRMRAEHQAIMVGINTVLSDNPSLTVRHVKGKDPLRIVLDSDLRIPKKAKVLKDKHCLIATTPEGRQTFGDLQGFGANLWVSPTKKQVSLKKLFRHLADIGISSVLVEPGPTLYRSLMKQWLVDEMVVYVSEKKLGKGLRMKLGRH